MKPVFFTLWVVYALIYPTWCIPSNLLYDHDVLESEELPTTSDVSSTEIALRVPIVFFGIPFDTVFVNSNGLISFQTEIQQFLNIEFPLDYPIIAPFYSHVDTTNAGVISYYETDSPGLLERATNNVHDAFSDAGFYQATSLFIATWHAVGYYKEGNDKLNTFQVAISTDGQQSYAEFLYPENGIQWIQGTGDESGLPDARAQAGIISPDGKLFTLPGSGTEQVKHLESWTNMDLTGQFIFRIDQSTIREPDLNNQNLKHTGPPERCSEAPTYCHVQAQCKDYDEGFCCECRDKFYGNGKNCIRKDLPLRVNGKVNGIINGERLDNLDLQSYVVMNDARAYTAISKIPESIGFDIQSLQILGGVIGYLFAKPLRGAVNGYQLTGGVFNHSATITFLNTSQVVKIKQKYLGLDVFDQLRLEAFIQGEIPNLPDDAKVNIDEYQEEYTLTNPGLLQMHSRRSFKYTNALNNEEIVYVYNVEQSIKFDYCRFENKSIENTWKLKVGKNFISYEAKEQIIRYGLSNKIIPFGDSDPCDEGRSKCGPNSSCVVDNETYRCVCNPGYQQFHRNDEVLCADIDECISGQHDCDYNAQCHNVVGGFLCRCNPGFEGNGQYCENARSCSGIQCPENSECVESNEVAQCRCQRGFTGDGQTCKPAVDHSCHVANNCSPYGICEINPQTNNYHCACLPNYEGNGYDCRPRPITTTEEVPQDTTITPVHRQIQRCILGVCWCPEGYLVESGSKYCISPEEQEQKLNSSPAPETDVNETNLVEVQCFNSSLCFCPKGFDYDITNRSCSLKRGIVLATQGSSGFSISCDVLHNCHRDAQCLFSQELGSYTCQCNEGFEGDGYSCEQERISCSVIDNCDHLHATCTYSDDYGKSVCICNEGFEGDGYTCYIKGRCSATAECTSTEKCILSPSTQRYECVCKENHHRDSQHHCVPSETRSCGGGTCVENAECVYDEGIQTFFCTCKPDFIGDGITECRPKPVGCDVANNCGLQASCLYDEQTTVYTCRCNEGFLGDGFVCYKERTCQIDPSLCHPQASCVAEANRKFVCHCNSGYVGNGTICKPIPTHEGNFLLLNYGIATLKIGMEPSSQKHFGKPIQVRFNQVSVGLDIDCVEGKVYWSDITNRAIRSSNFNGSEKQDFITEALGSPEGLAIDWVSRNIYWTDSTNDTIEVASLDSRRRRTLFDTDLVNPRGIAVHPQRGKIFWTDWNRRNPKIEWANADGTGREIFLRGVDVSLPNSLTIDYDTDNLCYADAGTKKIQCVNIDTRVKQTMAVNCTYPFGITVTDTHIYWSDWISKKIERVDKYTLKRVPPIQVPLFGSGGKLYGLVAVPKRCPQITNVCQYYRDQCPAEHICLPNGSGSRSCVCSYRSEKLDEHPTCVL